MTFAFALYVWVKHLQGPYGKTGRALIFFAAVALAVMVDGSGWLEALARVAVALGPVAWRSLGA